MPSPTSCRACSGRTSRCPVGVLRRVDRPAAPPARGGPDRAGPRPEGRGRPARAALHQRHLDHLLTRGVVVVADDLMWSTRIAEAVRRAGGTRRRRWARTAELAVALEAHERGGPGHRSAAPSWTWPARRFDAVRRHRAPARGAPAGHRRGPARRPADAPPRPGRRRQPRLLVPASSSAMARAWWRAGWRVGARPRRTGRAARRDGRGRVSASHQPRTRFARAPGARPGSRRGPRRPRRACSWASARSSSGWWATAAIGHERLNLLVVPPARAARPSSARGWSAAAAEQAPGLGSGGVRLVHLGGDGRPLPPRAGAARAAPASRRGRRPGAGARLRRPAGGLPAGPPGRPARRPLGAGLGAAGAAAPLQGRRRAGAAARGRRGRRPRHRGHRRRPAGGSHRGRRGREVRERLVDEGHDTAEFAIVASGPAQRLAAPRAAARGSSAAGSRCSSTSAVAAPATARTRRARSGWRGRRTAPPDPDVRRPSTPHRGGPGGRPRRGPPGPGLRRARRGGP